MGEFGGDDSIMRKATKDDLDDLVDIMCAAMPMDPQWDYRFPKRRQFPEDNRRCTRKMMERLVNDDEKSHTVVRVIAIPSSEKGKTSQAVALAVWEMQVFDVLEFGKKGIVSLGFGLLHLYLTGFIVDCNDRRDADFARMKAFDVALADAKKTHFDKVYGDRQVYLVILATHPKYQRHGAGTRHCQWGMQLAKTKKAAVTLFSSPMGTALYTELGFKMLDHVSVQVTGEEEKLSIGVMTYDKAFSDS